METLEKSRMCRLCGKQSGIAIDIFDKNESHVRKINAILPILVHEMDLLPKQMCHRCSYKLEEFYNFYVECAKTDRELKSQLSWMSKEDMDDKKCIPMVKMNKFKVKTEPIDNDSTDPSNAFGRLGGSSLFFPASILQYGTQSNLTLPCAQCKCVCNRNMKVDKTSPKSIKIQPRSESENKAHNSQVISRQPCVLIESMDFDHKIKCTNNVFQDSKFSQTDSQHRASNHIDNKVFVSLDILDSDMIKSEKLNRALRPRKSSVDYVGPKKKMTTNLKANVKSKLDYIDLSLVNPVDIKVKQDNANHSSPIIKLEKIDDPVKSLRTQKNLELFNKTVKEFQRKKKKNLGKNNNQRRKSFLTEVKQKQKNEKFKEEPISSTKRKAPKEENSSRKSLKIEKQEVECTLQSEENMNGECSTSNHLHDFNNDLIIVEPKVKDEPVDKIIKIDESFEEHSVLENTVKPVDRLPFCALVKLENDYSCNVDYPKVHIRRHSTVAISTESQESSSTETSAKQKDHSEIKANKKSVKNDLLLKNLRNDERRMKVKNHKTKSSNKNSKRSNSSKKRTVFDKELAMMLHQSVLKCYCEECNTSFGTRELYRLHPCYQK